MVQDCLNRRITREAVVVLGTAGSGKSTILKRLAVTLVNAGIPVYFSDGHEIPKRESVRAFVEILDRQPVFILDNAHRYATAMAEWAESTRGHRFQPLFICASRPHQYERQATAFRRLNGVGEIEVHHLSDAEIPLIIEKLEANGLLGNLRQLTLNQQTEVFRKVAWKQLLVAMREATQGKAFDDIIRDEFESVPTDEGKRLYLIVAIPSSLQYSIHRGEILAASGLAPAETFRVVAEELKGLVVPYGVDGERYMVRHPLIALHVLKEIAPRALLKEAYIEYLLALANSIDRSRGPRDRALRTYMSVINHRHLFERFDGSVDYPRAIYDELRASFAGDGHFWLQYGSFELLFGDVTFAENYLLQAQALHERDDLVDTALGHLYLKKAADTPSLEEAIRLRTRGEELLRPLVAKRGRYDFVVYHVLGSQLFGWIRNWSALLTSDAARRELAAVHQLVREGLERHPQSEELQQLENDVRRELLLSTTTHDA